MLLAADKQVPYPAAAKSFLPILCMGIRSSGTVRQFNE
jgi:hypothetical protein